MSITKQRKIKLLAIGILIISSLLIWSAYFSLRPTDKMQVRFFDVGQGDATMIETPGKSKILIDGGPDNSILAKVGRALSFYDRGIEVMIVTHPDSDHLAGAVEIAKNYDIGLILINGKECATKICEEFDKVIKEKNIKTVVARKGQKIDFGGGVDMDILLPAKAIAAEKDDSGSQKKNEDNNSSIISYLKYGADSFLFTGDAEAKQEKELIAAFPDLTAEVLKVAHHGSKNSSSEKFLEKIKPKFSVISAGAKNRYGHPHLETVERLKKIGSEIFRTDTRGDISFEASGNGVSIK